MFDLLLGTQVIQVDEHPRHGTKLEKLQKLKAAFQSPGSVTAGNSSGINDGAACVMLMKYSTAQSRGIVPMAKVVAWAQAGVDPKIMGTGPIPAIKSVVRMTKLIYHLGDICFVCRVIHAAASPCNDQFHLQPSFGYHPKCYPLCFR